MRKGKREKTMDMKVTFVAASILSMGAVANADIVYSGMLDITVEAGGEIEIDINGNMWQLGILTGGPLDYAYVTALDEGAGVFVPLLSETEARNFDDGDEIGTLTSVLNMYPLGPGDENINLLMHDFTSGDGNFDANGTGFIGFGFGGGVDFNYGWMQVTLASDNASQSLTLVDFAYNDAVNGSIEVGAIPAPGALGLLALGGLAGRPRRRA